jgi:hypothetical protein
MVQENQNRKGKWCSVMRSYCAIKIIYFLSKHTTFDETGFRKGQFHWLIMYNTHQSNTVIVNIQFSSSMNVIVQLQSDWSFIFTNSLSMEVNCLYIDTCIWCLFFIKKNVTKCLGHHYAIWTSDSNFLLAQKNNFGPA